MDEDEAPVVTSDQKNWDAALIKTWRLAGTYQDALLLFKALSGKRTDECDPPIKRIPKSFFPYNVGIRVYIAEHLPKISDRLWNQTQDKDILLLRKLETSPYDSLQTKMYDSDQSKLRYEVETSRKKIAMESLSKSIRNQATDWNVTKGPARVRVKRR
jgi:hypothetical protein